jgi:GLPGLI family protein
MKWRFIPVSGGPESFNGLTGMILQVADMISKEVCTKLFYIALLRFSIEFNDPHITPLLVFS